MSKAVFQPLSSYIEYPIEEMNQRATEFRQHMQRRRSVRHFSSRPVPREVIEECLLTAASAPNGANLQPWRFVVVSDPKVKHEIRIAAEQEEREFYERRAPQEWLDALSLIGTDEHKPFLEAAPCLIIILGKSQSQLPDGRRVKNYYVNESVGIATGFLIAAIHNAGLVSLTHTPSPMGFLNDILHMPPNEKPFLILVVGYPGKEAQVPEIEKKSLEEIATFI
ncbi:MAG TPA: nitroreductase family protein [Anaerolineales bacterium]|nr:nitroreductase family protein [Anaerolineales bacterium]